MSPAPLFLPPAYLLGHSLLVLISRRLDRAAKGNTILVNGVVSALFFLMAGTVEPDSTPVHTGVRFLQLWSPVIFFWWAYLWAGRTLGSVFAEGAVIDPWLIRFESNIGQPSLNWMRKGNRALTELAHAFYGTYYFYTLGLGLMLHLAGRYRDFQAMAGSVCLGYLISYLLFALVPAQGPRWSLVDSGLAEEKERTPDGHLITKLTLRLMYGGPAHRGGAMPSSHTSTAVVFVWWAFEIWGWPGGLGASVIAIGMCLGAIYGRYHFVTDILVGAIIGAGVIPAGYRLAGF